MASSLTKYLACALRSVKISQSHYPRCIHTTAFSLKNKKTVKKVASAVSSPSLNRIKFSQGEDKRRAWLRKVKAEEEVQGRHPDGDVYYESYYAPQILSLQEAVDIHRELAVPEMLNHENGELHVEIQLNMRTIKSTKFIVEFSSIVLLPHTIDFVPEKKILVFTDDPELRKLALENGALDADGDKLVEQIEHGHYHWESYDNVVCHTDFLPKLRPIRKLLRERLPNPKSERVGTDIEAMLRLHKDGIAMLSKKEPSIPEIATIQVPLGRLNWSVSNLEENYFTYVSAIDSNKIGRRKGKAIESVELIAPPSPLRLRLVTSLPEEKASLHANSNASEVTDVEEDDSPTPPKDELAIDDDDDDVNRVEKKK